MNRRDFLVVGSAAVAGAIIICRTGRAWDEDEAQAQARPSDGGWGMPWSIPWSVGETADPPGQRHVRYLPITFPGGVNE